MIEICLCLCLSAAVSSHHSNSKERKRKEKTFGFIKDDPSVFVVVHVFSKSSPLFLSLFLCFLSLEKGLYRNPLSWSCFFLEFHINFPIQFSMRICMLLDA